MKTFRIIALFAVVIYMAGCASTPIVPVELTDDMKVATDNYLKGFDSPLKDPESAWIKLDGAVSWKETTRVCGQVRAKNSLGGYADKKRFMLWYEPGKGITKAYFEDTPSDGFMGSVVTMAIVSICP